VSPTATSPIIKRRIAIRLIQGFSYEANAPHGDTDHVRIPQDHAIRDRTPRKRRPILAAAREIDLHFAVLIQVMAQGGLRPGEVMAVRRQDVSAAGAVHVQGGQRRRGRGPTKNPHSVRKVSVLHPTTEDRAIWHPQDARNATSRVLDGPAPLTALAHDGESRLWPISATRLDRTWKKVLRVDARGGRHQHCW